MSWPGFFLVGTGRCGSSLLRKLIGCHPEVHVPQETHWIPILYDQFGTRELTVDEFYTAIRKVYLAKGRSTLNRILKQNGHSARTYRPEFEERVRDLAQKNVATLTTAFLEDITARNGKRLWGEKTPDYGHCMGMLHRLWPDARFVNIVRDGRDVALSMMKVRSFRFLVAWGVSHWPYLAVEKAYEAREEIVQGDLPADAFFELWRRRLLRTRDEATRLPSGTYLEIRYDDLLRHPVAVLDHVADHLRLPGDRDWIEQARAMIDPGNVSRNAGDPAYEELTERHSETLRAMGF